MKDKYIYSAKHADAAVSRRRSENRKGVRISDDKKQEMDELVTRLVKKGQPLTHIYAEHENEMPVCLRTLYNYIDDGGMIKALHEGDGQMKIIVTKEGMLWNDKSPALLEYAEDVIVISYYMKEADKHNAKYRYLDIKIPEVLGMDDNGAMTSPRYRALADNIESLKKMIGWEHNILILSDNSICSLFPYKLLQSINERYRLHLWTIAPLLLEGIKKTAAYNEMVASLDKTESVLAMKLEVLKEHEKITLSQYFDCVQQQINERLPGVLQQIEHMYDHYDRKYFYDWNKGVYIDTTFEKEFISVNDEFYCETLGFMSYEGMVAMEKENQQFITQRSDGKELCNKLKRARNDLAVANGIDFHAEECSFNGACGGTCTKCDEELRFLMEKMSEIEPGKRVYPELIIDEKFVSGHANKKQDEPQDEPAQLMGLPVPLKNTTNIPEFLRRDTDE